MPRRLLREPLVHFLVIGLLLFLLYALMRPVDMGGDSIVVSRPMVEELAVSHAKLWGRPPTPDELQQLITARVDEEILYREGVSMGLDRDDAVIKRRVRQKYELIAEETDSEPATDADLAAYLKAHPDRFRTPPMVQFRQIVLPVGGSEAQLHEQAESMLAELARGADPTSLGQPTMLPFEVPDRALDLVEREFGADFANALARLAVGRWQGPVASGYGLHLVFLQRRTESVLPPLEAIRAEVLREWENARRVEARAARLAELRGRYAVVVEGAP